MTAIHFENGLSSLKLILLFHIEETEKSPKCKMEENSGVIANVGKLNEPSLGLVIIAACLYAMSDELICIVPSFTLPVL
jgi:hypothetical protein